jgi:hypothetical protein
MRAGFPWIPVWLLAASVLPSCFLTNIPNTDIPDTHENREVVEFAERYRHAVEQRDIRTLLAMAAPNYFEDAGTPQGDDDYGYDGLRRVLGVWSDTVREIRYEMRYRRVAFENDGQRALIDYTYTGSFTLMRAPVASTHGFMARQETLLNADPARGATPINSEREVWYRRVADNRLELEKVQGQWRIAAGM